jgi:hypothetical protein
MESKELAKCEHKHRKKVKATHSDIVLRGRSSRDHDGSGVLNLHFMKKNVPVFGELNLPRAINQHFESAAGTYQRHRGHLTRIKNS